MMLSKVRKIFNYFPSYPHYKMNVFSGTNNFSELTHVFKISAGKNVVRGNCENDFVEKLKEKLGAKHFYTFASGRMGFFSILQTIGIQKDDEIIIPSFTCIVIPNAILYSGAKPVYCEVNKSDFNIDVEKIEALITPKTKILYAQHTFGQMCDMDAIMKIANKHGLLVVEDAALALGASYGSKQAGTIGDFGFFSTDRSKVINTGLGGIVSINNEKFVKPFEDYYESVPYLNSHFTKKIVRTFIINLLTLNPNIYWLGKFINLVLSKLGLLTYFKDELIIEKKDIRDYPYPARLSNAFAFLGVSQVSQLATNIANRKRIAKYYNDILKIYSEDYLNSERNIFLRYSFLINNRDAWEKKYSNSIDLSIWFKSIASGRTDHFEEINYHSGQNKNSEYCTHHVFNLPTHNLIRPEKLKKLLVALKESGDIITKERVL